jgi:heavy metal sensor kinase
MLKSLRAKLLAWYSLVLVVVLATFTQIAVWTVWQSNLEDVDQRLGDAATRLAGAVSADPAGGFEVNLAGEDLAEFGASDQGPYYALWTSSGSLIDRSDPQVDTPFPGGPHVRTLGSNREVAIRGHDGVVILVGQSLDPLRANRWQTVLGLIGAGGAALALALLGGWFLVGRALSPIGRIGETAAAMSEANLGLRVDVSRTEDELGRVAVALNRAFDRLQDAFERQTRFTADASHELRTPLAALLAELEWARTKPRSEAEYRSTLEVCARAAQRMRTVVDGLLTLARADAGALPPRREPVNLTSLVQETVATAMSLASERGVTVTLDGAPVSAMEGDPDRLRELISNLVVNAVQYSPPGGVVRCSISSSNGMLRLDVTDSGPGIDPQDLPHIFERFYRANKARSRSPGGAGLGLAISKWIAETHGGRIRCESSAGGSCFTVELPAAGSPLPS